MSSDYLKPNTKGMRDPLDNGSAGDKIANPPRWAGIGGLTSAAKIMKNRFMRIVKPGRSSGGA